MSRAAKRIKAEKIDAQPLLKSSITSSTTTTGLTLEELKSALTSNIPIEQVVYLNDSRVVDHEEGSNRYYVNYPDTWRTVTNQQLVLGVRAIRKYWANMCMEISLTFRVNEVKIERTFDFRASILPIDMLIGKEKEFIDRINEQWTAWTEQLSEEDRPYLIDIVNSRWLYYYDLLDQSYVIRSPCPMKADEFIAPYTITISKAVISRDVEIFFSRSIFFVPNPKSGGTCTGFKFHPQNNAFKYFNDTYLLAASFVGQTNYQYLGYTNTEFIPLKQYIIPNGDTRFWVDIVTADALEPVELDFRDMIAIEFQLTTIPHIHRV